MSDLTTSSTAPMIGTSQAAVHTTIAPPKTETKAQRLIRKHYPEVSFGGYSNVSGTVAFYTRVNALVKPDSRVLDIGCGRGAWMEADESLGADLRNVRGRCQKVIGIDMDDAGYANKSLDEYRKIENGQWPVDSGTVDLAVCDYVLEHITDVDGFFRELARVLAPGGVVCFRTPNKWFYVSVISRLIPNRLHSKVVGKVQSDRQEQDVFDTVYKCNTGKSLAAAFRKHQLEGVVTYHEAEPLYLMFNSVAFTLGVIHQRFAPKYIRANLLAFARKNS